MPAFQVVAGVHLIDGDVDEVVEGGCGAGVLLDAGLDAADGGDVGDTAVWAAVVGDAVEVLVKAVAGAGVAGAVVAALTGAVLSAAVAPRVIGVHVDGDEVHLSLGGAVAGEDVFQCRLAGDNQ